MDRSGNRRSPSPVRRTTLLYLGVATGALTLRRYGFWRPLHSGLTGQLVSALAATPEHPEAVYAAAGGTIFHSGDGGTRWRRVGAAPNGARVWSLLAGPRSANRLLAGLEPAGIIYSDNGGATWKPAALPPLPAGAVTHLLPPVGEGGAFYALVAGSILTSADAMKWQVIDSLRAPVSDIAQHPDSPATLYAAGPAGLFRTRNGGHAWQRLIPQPARAVLVHPNRPRTLIAALPGGLHQSPNAGVHWRPMAGGELVPDDPVVDLIGNPVGEVLLAVTSRGALLQLVDGRWEAPAIGPMPPVVVAVAASGEIAPWPGAPKRSQTRRRRPPRREGDGPEASRDPRPPAPPAPADPPAA